MHNMNCFKFPVLLMALLCFSHLQCTKEANETTGSIRGNVRIMNQGEDAIIHPAYIFHNDTLLATTNKYGEYHISALSEGDYSLICSALNYSNLVQQVKVVGGETTTQNFSLQPDDSRGILVGEFQDLTVLNDSLTNHPELSEWDDQQIYNAATGATIQKKWFDSFSGKRIVFLGNDSLGHADAWGQYAFVIQCGTYSFTGTCDGYKSTNHVVTIVEDTKTYLNFLLERE